MKLTKTSSESNSGGCTAANQRATELWEGEINGKPFTVLLDSMAAPYWSGDLNDDEREEIMDELYERSGLQNRVEEGNAPCHCRLPRK